MKLSVCQVQATCPFLDGFNMFSNITFTALKMMTSHPGPLGQGPRVHVWKDDEPQNTCSFHKPVRTKYNSKVAV